MRLKRLELQGFKSFVDRTILPFEEGITGVVGPNGCGKSNIVDAIQWVMGEQSAKHLRGDSMSDVIFNGSDTRAATSMAEVSLVMQTEGLNLPPHLVPLAKGDELAITRRIFRDGSAEYLINKQQVRLRDVHEVFMDTGVGRRAYSIIEQGQIDRMINVKPEDRRVIFEEVAGITKYKTKRREAERKLDATRLNIERVDDIIRELEKQIRSLKIQSTRARKYKEIKGELESIDLFVLGRKLYTLAQTLEDLKKKRVELVDNRSELDAEISRLEAAITEMDVLRIDQEKQSQEHEAKERELALSVQRLENQVVLFQQQREHIIQAEKSRSTELKELQESCQQMNNELAETSEEKVKLESAVSELTGSIEQRVNSVDTLQRNLRQKEHDRHAAIEQINQLAQKEVQIQKEMQHGQLKVDEGQARSEELNKRLTNLVVSLDSQKKGIEDAKLAIEKCQNRGSEIDAQVAEAFQVCQDLSDSLTLKEEALFKAREVFHSAKSRLESLTELQENLEGYSPTAREVLTKLEQESTVRAVPLAEILRPAPELEALLELLLGESVNTLIVRSREEAKEVGRLISQSDLERVGILSAEEAQEVVQSLNVSAPSEGSSLLKQVDVEPGYEAVLRWALGKVYVVSDFERLVALREEHPELTFVTRDGESIAYDSRLLQCGKVSTKRGIFARKREIDELTAECARLESQVREATTDREQMLSDLEAKEKQHADLKDSLSKVHIENVEYRKEHERLQMERERSDREYTEISSQAEMNSSEMEDLRTQLDAWKTELTSLTGSIEEAKEKRQQLVSEIEKESESLKTLQDEVEFHKIEKTKVDERLVSVQERVRGIESRLSEARTREESLQGRTSEEEAKLREIDEMEKTAQQEAQAAAENRGAVIEKLASVKEAHGKTCTELGEARSEKDEAFSRREKDGAELQDLEIRLTQEQASLEHQQQMALERYEVQAKPLDPNATLDVESLPLLKAQVKNSWGELPQEERDSLLDEHVESLRTKVQRYGEVNLTAISEFEEVQKRHDFLAEQRADLENSIKILESAIVKIDETTHARFMETFEGVNEKFTEVFPILFNGGRAELKLTNPGDLWESGVDVMAQPPGKKLQSISLLSGGEKALTAVSLVLAIFARKPSPFCLLDEVDAPLDEANVSRFNTVIQQMAQKSQFILVTHNRKTMDIVDALFGVTMEKPGVSKMTSVRLAN